MTDFGLRYRQFARLARTRALQGLARIEVGGTPSTYPQAYRLRSPMHWIEEIARSRVPLQVVELRRRDRRRPAHAVGAILRRASSARAERPPREGHGLVEPHGGELRARLQLPGAVTWLGLATDV